MRDDRGIDSDQLALIVHEGAAGVARVDRSIGLDEVFVVFDSQVRPPLSAHDSHRDCLAYAEGIADRNCVIADFHLRGIGNSDRRQIGRIDLENGDIGLRVCAHNFCIELAFVAEHDSHFRGSVDNVVVGQDVTVRAHNDSGSQPFFAVLGHSGRYPKTSATLAPEELAKQLVVGQFARKICRLLGHLDGQNIHH